MEWESGIGGEMVRTKRGKAEKAGGEGVAHMVALADQTLQDESPKMVEILKERELKGRESSVRLLLRIADRAQPAEEPEARDGGFSPALLWESEPPWLGEWTEAECETASSSRQPEG